MIDPGPQIRRLAEAELYRVELGARRAVRRLFLLGIALFFALFAIIMLGIAGFFYLSDIYGAPLAALITGAVLVALAGIVLLFAGRAPGRADRLELEMAERAVTNARADVKRDFMAAERSLNDMTFGLLGLVRGSGGSLSLLSLIIGIIAAMSPGLRRFLMSFLRKD